MSDSQRVPPCSDGLLIFQSLPSGGGGLVQVIEESTDSQISHVGIMRKKGDQCVVYEAIGQKVRETPIREFLGRSRHNWFREISGWSSMDTRKFLNEARDFMGVPYDFEFRHDNDAVYCSELVYLAGGRAGLDTFSGMDVPAHWLDFSEASARQYLSSLGFSGPNDPRLRNIRVITPRDLFYHNGFKGSDSRPASGSVPNQAVYDSLHGSNPDEKLQYLINAWGRVIQNVKVETDNRGGFKRYHFELAAEGRNYSLTLFGKFKEEEQLAQMILRELSSSSPRSSVPRSRLSDGLIPRSESSGGCSMAPLGGRP